MVEHRRTRPTHASQPDIRMHARKHAAAQRLFIALVRAPACSHRSHVVLNIERQTPMLA
jgi:hypothetical protein